MSAAGAEFYDRAMTSPDSPAMLELEDSPWQALYLEAARMIPLNHPVMDLGCGTARFGVALARTEHYGLYTGVDFAREVLVEAKRYLREDGVKAAWAVCDLVEWKPQKDRPGNLSYACLEVMEHLDDDIGLVERLPPGHQFVFSVPNYDSESHVRTFDSPSEVWDRYGQWLLFRRWSLVHLDDRKAIHVLDTRRRIDSWA